MEPQVPQFMKDLYTHLTATSPHPNYDIIRSFHPSFIGRYNEIPDPPSLVRATKYLEVHYFVAKTLNICRRGAGEEGGVVCAVIPAYPGQAGKGAASSAASLLD